MSKVFATYAESKGIQVDYLRFLVDGRGIKLKGDDTATTLELEDHDEIECLSEQWGGC